MKAGAEVHFLAGQIFTLAIAAVAILPRMPTDHSGCTIGGKLSHPFRRALVGLLIIGVVRVFGCHLHHPDSSFLRLADGVLGTLHVIGQSFLCLTTAYILRCQLCEFINIEGGTPGRSLITALSIISILTVAGAVLSELVHPNYWCLVNLAEAYSCFPVLKTLKLYASVTTVGGRQHRRGPVFIQILMILEYWYLATSILSFVGEAADNHKEPDHTDGQRLQLFLAAIRHNQDNGVDDWTRLMLHSVFLNSIDELQHFSSSASTNGNGHSSNTDSAEDDFFVNPVSNDQPLVLRRSNFRGGLP